MSTKKDTARAPIGVKRLVMWPQTTDDETTLSYGDAHNFENRLMTVVNAPNVVQAELSADDKVVEELAERTGGTLTIDLTDLTSEDRVLIFGENIRNGTNVANSNDISNYVAVAYMTLRSDGLYNLYKFMKVKFAPQSETNSTKQKGSITYATKQIVGNYIPASHSGDMEAVRRGVDPVAEADIIERWFTDGSYIGPQENTASATNAGAADEGAANPDDEPQG